MKIITNTYLVLPTKEEEPFAGQDLVAWILSKSIETMSRLNLWSHIDW